MKKFLGITLLAVLGLTMHTTEAKAFGCRKKNSGGCNGGSGYSSAYGGGGCYGGGGYANPVRYGSGYGNSMYYGSGYNSGYGNMYGSSYSTPMYGSSYSTPMYGNTYSSSSYYSAPVANGYVGSSPCVQTYGTVGSASIPPVAMPNAGTTGATTNPLPTAKANTATITVMLPSPDAQVWIDDNLTNQSGKERSLTTGTLADGKSYDYVVKAKWTDDNGKKVEKTKTVTVKAGQTSTADFR